MCGLANSFNLITTNLRCFSYFPARVMKEGYCLTASGAEIAGAASDPTISAIALSHYSKTDARQRLFDKGLMLIPYQFASLAWLALSE